MAFGRSTHGNVDEFTFGKSFAFAGLVTGSSLAGGT